MNTPVCWCGNASLEPFSADYLRCATCESLVWKGLQPDLPVSVGADEQGFYGKDYFQGHQQQHGLPDLESRARTDLTDRCPHWLRSLLKYRLPPARTLEIGSSHGGFVALLKAAGYQAQGLDLSPWVVDFSRQAFGIDARAGLLDQQGFNPASFDVIILMDVLEHLPEPLKTLQTCAGLLAPGGLVMLQTPRYPERMTLAQMRDEEAPIYKMLLPREHTFLFSRQAVVELARRAGIPNLVFEPACFADQDMAFFASAEAMHASEAPAGEVLRASSSSRLALALLDLHRMLAEAKTHLDEIDADRAARLVQILNLTETVHRLENDLREATRKNAELERIPAWLPRGLIRYVRAHFARK
jgi:SAM-dependent methyltransferase